MTAAAGNHFDLTWTRDTRGMENLISQQPAPIAVIVDNAVPQVNAIETLQTVRQLAPQARRILLSDHCDLAIIVHGLHTGAVERIVYRPIYVPELFNAIGLEHLPRAALSPTVAAANAAARPRAVG